MNSTTTPNHALQRTRLRVTACAAHHPHFTALQHTPRRSGVSLSFCSLGDYTPMSSTPDDDFPPDYSERIERVCGAAAAEFRSCRDDLLAQVGVCCRYFESGEREGISHGELIDFLGISSPSVLDHAGYSDSEAQRVMEALTLITYDSEGRPHAPSSIPASSTTPPPEQSDLRF